METYVDLQTITFWVVILAISFSLVIEYIMHSTPFNRPDFASGTNADAVITYRSEPDKRHYIKDGFAWSYSDAPTGGRIKVEEDSVIVLDLDITAGGPGFIPFNRHTQKAKELKVTLYAGGVGVVGKLNVLGHSIET